MAKFSPKYGIYNTYEELELIDEAEYLKKWDRFIIPMRNWNTCNHLPNISARPIYNTYEELELAVQLLYAVIRMIYNTYEELEL